MQVLRVEEDRAIAFHEEDLLIRTLEGKADMTQAYKLRHRVFAEQLHWVAKGHHGLEFDAYDAFATSVGIFDGGGELRGMFRMVNSTFPFMLESEFRACLLPTCEIRKTHDAAEITRLAVDPTLTDKGLSNRLMQVLFKGVYQWSMHNDVRYLYMVVEKRFLRVLRGMGFTCEAISPAVSLPPAQAVSIAAVLDWEQFHQTCPDKQPSYYSWMNAIDGSQSFERSRFVARDSKEEDRKSQPCRNGLADHVMSVEAHPTLAAA
ncbi:MAG: GNAT family N-acetyltransferase [Nitrospira sp.]|nr:GNAT family N-acetyltransferase [Nitrospira sp.]